MSLIPVCRPSEGLSRAGFTLIELLVALTIGGLLSTILFQLMQGNSRFVAMQSAREEVQQNGRASLDLIAGDLRALPSSAIQDMQPHSVRFYLPRGWGVLCNQVTATTLTAYVIFPAGAFPEEFRANAAHWGVALEQTADPGASTGAYGYVRNAQRVPEGTECDAIHPDAGNASRYYTTGLSVGSSLVDAALLGTGAVILPGTQVMIFEEVRYDVELASSGPGGYWLRRMSGYSGDQRNMQPMAGPLPTDTSLVFRYLQQDGVSTAAQAADVRRIRVWLEVQSRSGRVESGVRRPQQVDTVTTDVILRNR
jgi:prepilin-type N-terminal cleavage/methylation domain-containing protein